MPSSSKRRRPTAKRKAGASKASKARVIAVRRTEAPLRKGNVSVGPRKPALTMLIESPPASPAVVSKRSAAVSKKKKPDLHRAEAPAPREREPRAVGRASGKRNKPAPIEVTAAPVGAVPVDEVPVDEVPVGEVTQAMALIAAIASPEPTTTADDPSSTVAPSTVSSTDLNPPALETLAGEDAEWMAEIAAGWEEGTILEETAYIEETASVEQVASTAEATRLEEAASVEATTSLDLDSPVEEIAIVDETASTAEPTLVAEVTFVAEPASFAEPAPNAATAFVDLDSPVEETAIVDETASIAEPAFGAEPASTTETTFIEQIALVEDATFGEETTIVEDAAFVEQIAFVDEDLIVEEPTIVEAPSPLLVEAAGGPRAARARRQRTPILATVVSGLLSPFRRWRAPRR